MSNEKDGPRAASPDPEEVRRETELALDALAAEFHERMTRDQCQSVGAIYARYSSRFQQSIEDQVRSVLEEAARRRIFVPREFICFDQAVRGYKRRRPGLERLAGVLGRRGAVDAVLVFSTNRLARKFYQALQFVEEEVVEKGVRCIFATSGVDTATKNWRTLLQAYSMSDETVVAANADHVRASHEGLFVQRRVHGTIPYGYRGREVEGGATRRNRPRRVYDVDGEAAAVRRAYEWYVLDGLSIGELVRRLNGDPRAPRNARLKDGRWTHPSVRRLLGNPRYRGWWEYGRNQSVWLNKKDYVRQVRRAEPLKEAQWEELRVVPDELWHRAQARLADRGRRAAGRNPRDGDRRSRPRALDGLFACGAHRRIMYVGGDRGRMLICRACQSEPRAGRPLCSMLNRSLALKLTCRTLADRVRGDAKLVAAVVDECRRLAADLQRPDPGRVAGLRAERAKLSKRIEFLLDNLGDGEEDRRESAARLRDLRRERSGLDAELAGLEADAGRVVVAPDEAAVRDLLARLGRILEQAASEGVGGDAREVRRVVDELTGGRIELFQMGGREPKRGWLQGRFRLALPGLPDGAKATGSGEEVRIDYREPPPHQAFADEAKRLADEGLLIKEIAARLGVARNAASRALAWWHRSRGLTPPDGRSRRSTLAPERRTLAPPPFVLMGPEALRLCDEGLLYEEIAARLGCDRNTAVKAIRHASESLGRPVPDGRTRRKELGRYNAPRSSRRPDAPAR